MLVLDIGRVWPHNCHCCGAKGPVLGEKLDVSLKAEVKNPVKNLENHLMVRAEETEGYPIPYLQQNDLVQSTHPQKNVRQYSADEDPLHVQVIHTDLDVVLYTSMNSLCDLGLQLEHAC